MLWLFSYLSVLLAWIEQIKEVEFGNQNIPWATKPSVLWLPQGTQKWISIPAKGPLIEKTALIHKGRAPRHLLLLPSQFHKHLNSQRLLFCPIGKEEHFGEFLKQFLTVRVEETFPLEIY